MPRKTYVFSTKSGLREGNWVAIHKSINKVTNKGGRSRCQYTLASRAEAYLFKKSRKKNKNKVEVIIR